MTIVAPILLACLFLAGTVTAAVILGKRNGPKVAILAGTIVASLVILCATLAVSAGFSRQRAANARNRALTSIVMTPEQMARDPMFRLESNYGIIEPGTRSSSVCRTAEAGKARASNQIEEQTTERSVQIVADAQGRQATSETTVEYRSNDLTESAAKGFNGPFEPTRRNLDRLRFSQPLAFVATAGAVSLLILIAYLFVDARRPSRYTWLRRGIWATAFVAVCLLLLWAGPLVR